MKSGVIITVGRDLGAFIDSYASHSFTKIGEKWTKYTCRLIPSVTDNNATFMIRFTGTGTIWIDEVSLVSAETMQGWRIDVIDRTRKLKPNILRFPGGCFADDYHWKGGIGDRDKRPASRNLPWGNFSEDYRLTRMRGNKHSRLVEPNDVGTDEFLSLCKYTQSEPLICVNFGSASPEEAADWVEYCNGTSNTKYGSLRGENGYPKPYGVKYWEVGNEIDGQEEIGHTDAMTYAKKYLKFYSAMKKVDPRIKIIAVGASYDWNRTVLKVAGNHIDYLDLHYYPGFGVDPTEVGLSKLYSSILAQVIDVENNILETAELIEGLRLKVRIAVCEWNVTGGAWGIQRAHLATLGNGLFCALMLNVFQRNASVIEIANFSNLTNSWYSNCIRTNNLSVHVTPAYHVLQMYSHYCGVYPISTITDCDKYKINRKEVPYLDVAASLDSSRKKLSLGVVNRHLTSEISAAVFLDSKYRISSPTAKVWTVTGPNIEAINDFDHPNTISLKSSFISLSNRFNYVFPARSVSIITCNVS